MSKFQDRRFTVRVGDTKEYRDNYDNIDWSDDGKKPKNSLPVCPICTTEVSSSNLGYNCALCGTLVHVGCATFGEDEDLICAECAEE